MTACTKASSAALAFIVQTPSCWYHPLGFAASRYVIMMRRRMSDSTRAFCKDECADSNQSPETGISMHDRHHRLQQRRMSHKYGRAHRKVLKSRKRNEDFIASDKDRHSSQEFDKSSNDDNSVVGDDTNQRNSPPPEGYVLPNGEFVFGSPYIGNPIRERYIRSLQKINYPKTIHGWKTVFRKAWEKYLWTFEGFLLKEKKRDANGNVILPKEGGDNSEKTEEDNGTRSLSDTATDVASDVAKNVQKNITTLQQEAPHLLRMGQQITGVSTKEELREWVRDQLQLGTACITEFMAGYRKGRDEEIDRMLHTYFNEIDDKNTKAVESTSGGSGHVGDENDSRNEKASEVRQKRGKRAWGRSERRRLKELSKQVSIDVVQHCNEV